MRLGFMRIGLFCALGAGVAASVGLGPDRDASPMDGVMEKIEAAKEATAREADKKDPRYVLGFEMKGIDGKPVKLEQYRGKVVLIVNTASRCGFTPQYADLEAVYKKYKDRGLVVLGFPANDFKGQEPGTDEEIAAFCTGRYHVTFPMFSKVTVVGEEKCPLYKRLAAQPEPIGGEHKWNFNKFLVSREGRVVARYEPKVRPVDEKVTERIEKLLGPAEGEDAGKGEGGGEG